jgi:hypothetical protein
MNNRRLKAISVVVIVGIVCLSGVWVADTTGILISLKGQIALQQMQTSASATLAALPGSVLSQAEGIKPSHERACVKVYVARLIGTRDASLSEAFNTYQSAMTTLGWDLKEEVPGLQVYQKKASQYQVIVSDADASELTLAWNDKVLADGKAQYSILLTVMFTAPSEPNRASIDPC